MTIFDDIEITKSYIELSKVFAGDADATKAIKPIHDALERVARYAHDCAKKEFLDDGMEKLTKIMKGDLQ